jgi:cytoskeletal protein RodZ
MDEHKERKTNGRGSQRPLGQRVLALLLVLTMIFAYSVVPSYADTEPETTPDSATDTLPDDDTGDGSGDDAVTATTETDEDGESATETDTDADIEVTTNSVGEMTLMSETTEKDIAEFINNKSSIEFYVDGKWWTLDDLNAAG